MTVEAEDCSMLRCTSLCEGDELGYVSGIDDNDIPEEYLCVITQSVMKDPVVLLTEAGCSYERRALERWLDEHPRRDPLTNKDYPHKLKFGPNRSLKVTIDRWRRMSYRRKVAPAANRRAEIEASARQDKLREILDTPRRRRLRRGKQSSRAVSRPLRVESQSAARYRAVLIANMSVPDGPTRRRSFLASSRFRGCCFTEAAVPEQHAVMCLSTSSWWEAIDLWGGGAVRDFPPRVSV